MLRGNQVIAYETDRKEQTYIEFGSQSLVDFMADATVPEEIKRWAESSAKNNNWPSLSPLFSVFACWLTDHSPERQGVNDGSAAVRRAEDGITEAIRRVETRI